MLPDFLCHSSVSVSCWMLAAWRAIRDDWFERRQQHKWHQELCILTHVGCTLEIGFNPTGAWPTARRKLALKTISTIEMQFPRKSIQVAGQVYAHSDLLFIVAFEFRFQHGKRFVWVTSCNHSQWHCEHQVSWLTSCWITKLVYQLHCWLHL